MEKYIVLLFVLLMVSCKKEGIEESSLFGCWIHSIEESNANNIVYRPCEFDDWNPTWYRNSFHIYNGSECDFLILASNDAHYMDRAIWEFNEQTQELKITFNSDVIFQKKVITMEEDLIIFLRE